MLYSAFMTMISRSLRPGDGLPLQRGMPERTTDLMELMQKGVVTAIAAAAGCSIATPTPDDGTDYHLTFHGSGEAPLLIGLQLKATAAADRWIMSPDGHSRVAIQARMPIRRYNEFCRTDGTYHKIVVIMDTTQNRDQWVDITHIGTMVNYKCYWLCLEGEEEKEGHSDVRIKAPASQIFDDAAVCGIFARLKAGEAL